MKPLHQVWKLTFFLVLVVISSSCNGPATDVAKTSPPGQIERPWHRSSKNINLPEIDRKPLREENFELVVFSVKAEGKSPGYQLGTSNNAGEILTADFELKDLESVLEKVLVHQEKLYWELIPILIAADCEASYKNVSDLMGAMQYLEINRFRFQLANVSGAKWDEISTLEISLVPIDFEDDEYLAVSKESATFPIPGLPLVNKKMLEKLNTTGADIPDATSLSDLPPPPSPRFSKKSSYLFPGTTEQGNPGGIIYIRLQANGLVKVQDKDVALANLADHLQIMIKDSLRSPLGILSSAAEAKWNDLAEMLNAVEIAGLQRWAFFSLEQEKNIDYARNK